LQAANFGSGTPIVVRAWNVKGEFKQFKKTMPP
jgi:hypothetical protein